MQRFDLTGIPMVETMMHTSKGNQKKWNMDGYWYKADHMGYEGLAEYLVSAVLKRSDIAVPYVEYTPVQIHCDNHIYNGCRSSNFLPAHMVIIPLEKLFRQYSGKGLAKTLAEIPEPLDRIRFTVDEIEKLTHLHGFGAYLAAMLEADAFFLNEDRHTNNIAVLYDAEQDCFGFCPLFDQGLSLLSDCKNDYALELPLEDCLNRIEAKPFARKFDDQLDAVEELYGVHLHFHITANEIKKLLEPMEEYYDERIINRVLEIFRSQIRRYDYLIRQHKEVL